MSRYKLILVGVFIFIPFYIFFWIFVLGSKNSAKINEPFIGSIERKLVLGLEDEKAEILPTEIKIPLSFHTSFTKRKQFFNLSCEFAAASGAIPTRKMRKKP